MRAIKSNFKQERETSITPDLATGAGSEITQAIPTTAAGTAVTVAALVATAGYAYFRNLDATNFVEIGVQVAGTFYPLIKLLAGEVAVLRLATVTFYARADTGTVNLLSSILAA